MAFSPPGTTRVRSGVAGLSLTLCCHLSLQDFSLWQSDQMSLCGSWLSCCTVSVQSRRSKRAAQLKEDDRHCTLMKKITKLTTIVNSSSLPFSPRYQTYKTHFTVSRSPKSLLSLMVKLRSRISHFHHPGTNETPQMQLLKFSFLLIQRSVNQRQVFCPYVPSIQW